MGWFDPFHIYLRGKPRKQSDDLTEPCLSQDPPYLLAYFCWFIHERVKFQQMLTVVSTQTRWKSLPIHEPSQRLSEGVKKGTSQLPVMQQ